MGILIYYSYVKVEFLLQLQYFIQYKVQCTLTSRGVHGKEVKVIRFKPLTVVLFKFLTVED
jgi:hypothetical protein